MAVFVVDSKTVSPFSVILPSTTKSPLTVTVSAEVPIARALLPKAPPKVVFKFAALTDTSVFVIAPDAAPKYPHCVADIVVVPMFSN